MYMYIYICISNICAASGYPGLSGLFRGRPILSQFGHAFRSNSKDGAQDRLKTCFKSQNGGKMDPTNV